MAYRTILCGRNVIVAFAYSSWIRTIVTITALRRCTFMVERGWHPAIGGMTVVATFCSRNVGGCFTCGGGAVVAAAAATGDAAVAEGGRGPGRGGVATVTGLNGRDVRRGFAGGDGAVVAAGAT